MIRSVPLMLMPLLIALISFPGCGDSPTSPRARTWYVKPDSTGDTPTIQAAIDRAKPGDDVLVAAGTYTWTNQGDKWGALLYFYDKSVIWLHSEDGPEVTILDAEGKGAIIVFDKADNQTVVEGFTITGGSCSGIQCRSSQAIILNNVLTGNVHDGWSRGAIYCDSSAVGVTPFRWTVDSLGFLPEGGCHLGV